MPQQKQFKVLLIGDSCTDEYVYGICERLNPEAPVPILETKSENFIYSFLSSIIQKMESKRK